MENQRGGHKNQSKDRGAQYKISHSREGGGLKSLFQVHITFGESRTIYKVGARKIFRLFGPSPDLIITRALFLFFLFSVVGATDKPTNTYVFSTMA